MENVRLAKVRVCFEKEDILVCRFSIFYYLRLNVTELTDWIFNLSESNETAKLNQLLKFAKVDEVDALNRKDIRIILKDNKPYAFGALKEDIFLGVMANLLLLLKNKL